MSCVKLICARIASSCKTTEDPVDHDYADVNVSLDVWAAMTILYVMLEVGRLQSVIEAQDASNHNNSKSACHPAMTR